MTFILSNLLQKRLDQPSSWLFTAMKESLNQSVPSWLDILHKNGNYIDPIVHKESVYNRLANILQVMRVYLKERLLQFKTMLFLFALAISLNCQTPNTLVIVLFIVIIVFDPGKK